MLSSAERILPSTTQDERLVKATLLESTGPATANVATRIGVALCEDRGQPSGDGIVPAGGICDE